MAPIASTQRAHGDELGLLRGQLTNLRALLVLSILMTESADDEQILRLAASSAVSLGGWRIAGFAVGGAWRTGAIGISFSQNCSRRSCRLMRPIAWRTSPSWSVRCAVSSVAGGGSIPRIRHVALRSFPRPPAMCMEWTHSPSAHW